MSDVASTPRPKVPRRTALRHGLVATGTLAWSVPAVQALATTVASAQATSVVAPGPVEPTSGPSQTSVTAGPTATQTTAPTTSTSTSAPGGTSTTGTSGTSTSATAGEPAPGTPTSTTASAPGDPSGGRRSGANGTGGGSGGSGDGSGAGPVEPTGTRQKTTVAALVVFFEWKGTLYGAKLLKAEGVQPLRGRDTWMVPPGSPQWQPWQGGGKGGRDGDRRGLWVRLPKDTTLHGASALLHDGEVYSRYPASVTGEKIHCRDLT